MVSKLRQLVVCALAGTLVAVPAISDVLHGALGGDSAGYREVHLPAPNGVDLHQDRPSEGESEEDGNSYPAGRLSPEPGPLEMFKRGHRISGFQSTFGRSHEKQASVLYVFPAHSPGVRRTGMADRCIRSWLSIVAPPIQPHAPPQALSFLA